MSNPFRKLANKVNETQKQYEKRKESESKARECENCGAARPEAVQLSVCEYCGFRFMDVDIRLDKNKG